MFRHGLWHAFFGFWLLVIVSTAVLWSQIGMWEGLLTFVVGVPLWVMAYGWWYERVRRRRP
ncbi:MAG: hypothetical protein OXL97_12255 [Chloroflexota bacterium]|nr:hypothetical protein [Chloroflexota bacterium]MDE2884633.1 hypothetical protein [Chloroflexota bacterium]